MKLTSVAVGATSDSSAALSTALGLDFAATPWEIRRVDDAESWRHEAAPDQRWWGTYLVQAESLADARGLLPLLRSEGKAERLVLVIRDHFPPAVGEPRTSHGLRAKALTASCLIPNVGFAVVIEGHRWVSVHAAATAALATAQGGETGLALGGLRAGVLNPVDREWLAGDGLASLLTPELLHPDDDDIYAVDVIVGKSEQPLPQVEGRIAPQFWNPGPNDMPPVDTAAISPRGFRPYTSGRILDLTAADLSSGAGLTGPDLDSLRDVDYVAVDGSRFTSLDRLLARRLSQLGVAGVPVLATNLGQGVQAQLGDTLLSLFAAFGSADPPVQRESKSIDLRRACLEAFAPVQRWNGILGDLGRQKTVEPSVSILLATRRPDRVGSALAQIAEQCWEPLEVVLVLHGFGADHPSAKHSIDAYAGQLSVVPVSPGTVFGDALNQGTVVASGDYVTKMDDDDWYGPHHIRDLVRSAQHSRADMVGTQVEFVYLESLDITTRRPPSGEQYSDHVAGGTMMLRRDDLRQLGGWRPVHRAVDRCLLQAVLTAGGLIYRSHGQNYLMHRHAALDSHGGHTWNPDDSIFLQSVAEQWDGFAPPPQIRPRPYAFAGRSSNFSSYFGTENKG